MSDGLTVSVVIVSRGRPNALRRCLTAVSQLWYPTFEVIVVADPDSCTAMRTVPQATHVKLIPFDEANISAARNQGICAAAGEVAAFIDDDAVPEPTWLTFLTAPFAAPDVMAAGGFVRGRNGISWQSRANSVDRSGQATPIDVDTDQATILTPTADLAIKTEGTNMALRRSCIAEMGGFDPRFRFFLDETDLNLRLAALGLRTAITPRAQVHHGFCASAHRRADRVPTDLYEIGASWAVFLRKHCDQSQHNRVWRDVLANQRRRVVAHMVTGGLEPRDVSRLMHGLKQGFDDGMARARIPMPPLPNAADSFRPYPAGKSQAASLISGRMWSRSALRQQGKSAAAAGVVATVIRLSPTALYHRMTYRDDGYWEQTGGLFGKSERSQPPFRLWRFRNRVQAETDRVGSVRGLAD